MAASQPGAEAGNSRQRRASTTPGGEPQARVGGKSAEVTPARSVEPDVQCGVTVLDGDAGRRLAVRQAEVILDVLTWLHGQRHGLPPS
ncbi:hypothetical protein [Micromonospora craniellae]|uniref:Uncharacterized protein n=1 Tax=Micromonospora craniellae TaxID=2294034 RepID=A0A372FRC7_9ACTN|nr:hypothetical protein [Micromonospora craniellae]QOC95420.1 hypothetical protein ID554_31130 [Micromonospora craniellae]RFS40981.1 hypothetical protein D0Q02_29930 [Micromonospora craniellae]